MKRIKTLIIYILCGFLFLQNSIGTNAEEINKNTNSFLESGDRSGDEEKLTSPGEDKSISSNNVGIEDGLTNTEEIERENETDSLNSEEDESEPEKSIVNEAEEDPLYGRANGYVDEEFYGVAPLTDDANYIHNSRFDNYIIHNVIDVSKYQEDIDWARVKQSGIDYAIIRAGFRGYGDTGSLNLDPYFEQNINGALAAGIKVGVYFFSQAITEAEAVVEAEYVLGLIKGYDISLPVVIDYEYAFEESGAIGRLYNASLSKDTATKICQKFCSTVEENGYTAMVYANKSMLENGLNASELSEDYKIWLAHYTYCTDYEGDYDFWQYTPSGTVDGIAKNVDRSFWYEEPEIEYMNVAEGIYTIGAYSNTEKVIDIPNAKTDNGINAQIYTSNGTWAQKFYIRPEGEDTYIIMSANSGKVLEANGSGVVQNAYTGEEKQQWRFIVNSDESISISSVFTGELMHLTDGNTSNGTKIQLKKNEGTSVQKFYLNAEDEQVAYKPEDGTYIIETALLIDKVLNLKSDGVSLQISSVAATDLQKYHIRYIGSGCYKILLSDETKALTAGNGTKIYFEEKNSDKLEQKWIFKSLGADTYSVISVRDGKCLDVSNAKTEDGTIVQKYSGNGTTAQKFKLYKTKLGAEELEDGIYVIHSALNSSRVLDVSGGSVLSDANVQLYTANGTAAQQFIVKRSSNGTYSIYSNKSGMAVTVKDGKNANGTNVYQFYPAGGTGQIWNIVPTGKGYYKVVSAIGSKVLDVAGGKTANGTNIQIYTSNGTKAQRFTFEKVGNLDSADAAEKKVEAGTYKITSALNSARVLDISGGSLYSGANLQLYTSNNSSAQKFVIQQNAKTGLYSIISKKSGMPLVYANGTLKNSINVRQDNFSGDVGSQWKLKHIIGDYYMIYAGNSSFCLDVSGAKTANGTNIQIYSKNGSKAQIFKLEKLSNNVKTEQNAETQIKEGVYTISSALKSTMVLDVSGASTANGANIQLYTSNNTNAQKFIVKKLDNGYYTITAFHSKKLVSAKNSGTTNGTNVWQYASQGTTSQQWKIRYAGNGYYTILGVQSGKALDVAGGKTANGTNVQIYTSNFTAAQRFKFTQTTTTPTAKFVSDGNNGYKVNYEVYTKGNEASSDKKYYLMQVDSYSGKIYGSPLTSVTQNHKVSINVQALNRSKLKELVMDKLVLAVKLSDGTYKAVTNPVRISNPEMIAKNTAAIFKASSKKGLQGVAYASNGSMPVDARYANTKQTLLNLDIADVVNPKSDYTTFTYKGKAYKFSKCSDLVANVKSMNAGYEQYIHGNNGTTKVAVSLCLLLSYDSANAYLIDPAARSSGHRYYTLNVREQKSRETLEALFVYLGELFGQEDCYVTNWILGNEINSSKAWNYSGSLNFDSYMNCYTTAFQMLYNAVKSEKTGNTVSISLDNGWTAAPDTYAGKATLDSFAKKINALNPNAEWSISYHPYSYPLTRADFWNDSSNTTNSTSTKYISMKNITVLTNYAASLEKTYKMDTGSIRVLLTEQGYSYGAGAEKQATAIARGYYIAEFNDRIDAFIIRSIVDDAEEAKGKLYFGLMNSQQDKRIAFYVYEYMDSNLTQLKSTSASSVVTSVNISKFNSAKNILCNTNWKSVVPGFNAAKLAGMK